MAWIFLLMLYYFYEIVTIEQLIIDSKFCKDSHRYNTSNCRKVFYNTQNENNINTIKSSSLTSKLEALRNMINSKFKKNKIDSYQIKTTTTMDYFQNPILSNTVSKYPLDPPIKQSPKIGKKK
ncbi:unnamed protein product [Gordionus sp. m RMFG-2023]